MLWLCAHLNSVTDLFGGQHAFPVPVGREDTQPLKGQSTSLGPCFQCGKLVIVHVLDV